MATSYGWAGQVLRVDLGAGTCKAYPTNAFPLTDYTSGTTVNVDLTQFIGGHGLGYAVLAYEVPPGTAAFDPGNRVIFGVGPITGSGSPSSGRTSITSLHCMHKDDLVDGGQMGGHWGPELKYAGYDAVIIQGQAKNPVWLRIQDDKVTLEDASMLWGQGIYYSTNYIVNDMGPEAHVACIGPWSENGVRLSGMPAFGPQGPVQDKDLGTNDAKSWKLVLFIRHLPQITSEELDEMKKLNPKTDADRAEEEQEEQFLNGAEAPPSPAGHHH